MRIHLPIITTVFFSITTAHAEIITDGTLGTRVNLPGPDFQIDAQLGQQVGSNLFHSFQEFNLQNQESAIFSGPNSVQNIISRVTGGHPSTIDGMIRSTIPNADLYFLNPYGILFGANAKLDVQGSFYASTADYLQLQDGGRFEARHPNESSLTIAPTKLFGFLTDTPTPINSENSQLAVPLGKTLSFSGGGLNLTQTTLTAPSGRVDLTSVAGRGEIIMDSNQLITTAPPGSLTITRRSAVEVSGDSSGSVFIRGGALLVNDSAINANTLGIQANSGTVDIQVEQATFKEGGQINSSLANNGTAGNVLLKAKQVTLQGANFQQPAGVSGIFITTSPKSQGGKASNLLIEAQDIVITEGAKIDGNTSGQRIENGRQITLKAQSVILDGELSAAQSQNLPPKVGLSGINTGSGGKLLIEATSIHLKNGAYIQSVMRNNEEGATTTLRAERIELTGVNREGFGSEINAMGTHTSHADGGIILIEAKELLLQEGGGILGFARGEGKGADIIVRIAGPLTLTGTNQLGFSSAIDSGSNVRFPPNSTVKPNLVAGPAGNITVEAQKITLKEGSRISSSAIASEAFGSRRSGQVTVQADSIELSGVNPHGENEDGFGSGIYARTLGKGAGEGGRITVTANTLLIKEGGTIQSSTHNSSQGGDIDIQVQGKVTITGDSSKITLQQPLFSQNDYLQKFSPNEYNHSHSGIYASSNRPDVQSGHSGTISLHADDLVLDHQAKISSRSLGGGNAGELSLHAQTLQLTNQAEITTSAQLSSGGDIHLGIAEQLYLHHSQVTTSVQRGGVDHNGGNITVTSPQFTVLNQGKITAQAYEGRGGNIRIVAEQFIPSADSLISASSQKGISGEVIIHSPENSIGNSLVVLGTESLKADETKTLCNKRRASDNPSRFVVTSLSGYPLSPEDNWQGSAVRQ